MFTIHLCATNVFYFSRLHPGRPILGDLQLDSRNGKQRLQQSRYSSAQPPLRVAMEIAPLAPATELGRSLFGPAYTAARLTLTLHMVIVRLDRKMQPATAGRTIDDLGKGLAQMLFPPG